MKTGKLLAETALAGVLAACSIGIAWASDHTVNITPSLHKVEVMHHGKVVVIQRNQDKNHVIGAPYNKTSRACPPFCIQPMTIAPGVETVGELELMGYLKRRAGGDNSIQVIDSRTRDWMARGTIPGSVNIPWNTINVDFVEGFEIEAAAESIDGIIETQFGVRKVKNGWDFSEAKTLVLFCNGAWCPQSPTNIRTLLRRGYPPTKLKWYRGGMQSWTTFGLTIVKAKK